MSDGGFSKNFCNFFEWAESYLENHKKNLEIVERANISFYNGKCAGWCDGKTLAVANQNTLAEEVFVHEFSHMNQYIEKSPLWKKNFSFWNDLDKKRISFKSWKSVMDIIALERDCELRAIDYSKKWKLFDNKLYAQRANLYLHYYQYVFLKKKWVDSVSIYNTFLLNEMPTKIKPLESFQKIDMELMDLFDSCLIKGKLLYQKTA
jgi:hypothetical protein